MSLAVSVFRHVYVGVGYCVLGVISVYYPCMSVCEFLCIYLCLSHVCMFVSLCVCLCLCLSVSVCVYIPLPLSHTNVGYVKGGVDQDCCFDNDTLNLSMGDIVKSINTFLYSTKIISANIFRNTKKYIFH